MIQTTAHTHDQPLAAHPTRPVRVAFAICLVCSALIHLAPVVMIAFSNPHHRSSPSVSFINLNELNMAPLPPSPEIRAPKQARPPVEPQREAAPAEQGKPAEQETAAPPEAAAPPPMSSPLGLGMANGYFSTLADGATLREDIRAYYLDLLDKINEKWWQRAGNLKEAALHDGVVEILIGRDGTLHEARLTWNTGSREADRAIIDVLSAAAPFPRLPDSYAPELFRAPLRVAAPSHLLSMRRAP